LIWESCCRADLSKVVGVAAARAEKPR